MNRYLFMAVMIAVLVSVIVLKVGMPDAKPSVEVNTPSPYACLEEVVNAD